MWVLSNPPRTCIEWKGGGRLILLSARLAEFTHLSPSLITSGSQVFKLRLNKSISLVFKLASPQSVPLTLLDLQVTNIRLWDFSAPYWFEPIPYNKSQSRDRNWDSHICRHTLFYCASHYCTLQILWGFLIEYLWQHCIKQVYWNYFSKSNCFEAQWTMPL